MLFAKVGVAMAENKENIKRSLRQCFEVLFLDLVEKNGRYLDHWRKKEQAKEKSRSSQLC